ncbi:MAG: carbamoyltransferase HypF [Magnetococcales bacterium]|nr:carbamoyltransferase HypF [Magnetococcales bacterium]
MSTCIRLTVDLGGIVQGVGMRPTLQRLATQAGLGGWVQNRSGQVRLSLVGGATAIDAFLQSLSDHLPPNARIDFQSKPVITWDVDPRTAAFPFFIQASDLTGPMVPGIPADLAMCQACLAEILDPGGRRYGYPFTTCTQCGPRYTVVEGMPYDRERTSLRPFPLCAACQQEYGDPLDRRFHAESMACPRCGPSLAVRDAQGEPVAGEPLQVARAALAQGLIVAVRGMGGFLLAVDARSRAAIDRLRQRKQRPHKPFAVMARDLDAVRAGWELSAEVAALLAGPVAPVVVLDANWGGGEPPPQTPPPFFFNPVKKLLRGSGGDHPPRWGCGGEAPTTDLHPKPYLPLPLDLLSPDTATLGILLPSTPLQCLLFDPLSGDDTPPFDFLVMTSGNRRGEPICTSNAEAVTRLAGIADLFLCHNREIRLRVDDSVCIDDRGTPRVWRRARGYAPTAIALPMPLTRPVLAMGAELKNTVAVGFAERVVLSPHVGDLETPEAAADLEYIARQLVQFLNQIPQAVGVDRHPDLYSTRLGERLATEWGIPVVSVQHHHAHAVACMAEHGLAESLALVFDGTGYGQDGTLWGAELLHVQPSGFDRLATFVPVPLPGGDAAVRQPVRQWVGRLVQAGVGMDHFWYNRLGVTEQEARIWGQQCQQGVNAPFSHAAGRLFDSFAAWLGLVPAVISYEGQAAVRLEAAARAWSGEGVLPTLPFAVQKVGNLLLVDWAETFRSLAERVPAAAEVPGWAYALHQAVAEAATQMVVYGVEKSHLAVVVLSGGVFMNRTLTQLLAAALTQRGVRVLQHRQVPTNDGGIALGQAVIVGGG